jgi:hypothetical protein
MDEQLTDNEVGAIAALIGKDRTAVAPEYLAGYDTKVAAMAAERETQAAQMAEYNRLAAQGLTDAKIQQAMAK